MFTSTGSAPSQICRTRARRSNSAEFSTEQAGSHTPKQQHNITVNFQNKTLLFDTRTKLSGKRQIQALLLIHRLGTLLVVVFITHNDNSHCARLCNYCGNSSVQHLQLSGSAAPCRTQNADKAKPYRCQNAMDMCGKRKRHVSILSCRFFVLHFWFSAQLTWIELFQTFQFYWTEWLKF